MLSTSGFVGNVMFSYNGLHGGMMLPHQPRLQCYARTAVWYWLHMSQMTASTKTRRVIHATSIMGVVYNAPLPCTFSHLYIAILTNLMFSILSKFNNCQHWTCRVAIENSLPVLEQRAARIADLDIQATKSRYSI